MKSAKTQLSYLLALLCLLFINPTQAETTGTDGVGDKKKKKSETIKELTGDIEPIQLEDIEFNQTEKIRIYNKHNVLVYEAEGTSLFDIDEENLRKCFLKGEFVMKHNNINYYIINS